MRKLALLFLLFAFFLLMGQVQAAPSFVSGDLENDAFRFDHNIGEDLGSLGSRPLPQLRKDAQQALARKDPKPALNPLAVIVAANPKDAGAWLSYSWAAIDAAGYDETLKENATAAAYLAYKWQAARRSRP